jgi:hypothetical protein
MRHILTSVLLAALLFSCASAPPPWQDRYLDGLADYYEQGSGVGRTMDQADRNARISLVGYRQGYAINGVTTDRVTSFRQNGNEVSFELTTAKGLETVTGVLPAQTYIAERWRARDGSWWSLAVNEKPGAASQIQSLAAQRLRLARLRAVIPGWAQFTKREPRKGWSVVALQATGLLGWGSLNYLASDYRTRRDQASSVADYRYYDDWAKRLGWGSAGFLTLAAGTYLYNIVDGAMNRPATYRLLLTATPRAGGPSPGGLALVLQRQLP